MQRDSRSLLKCCVHGYGRTVDVQKDCKGARVCGLGDEEGAREQINRCSGRSGRPI